MDVGRRYLELVLRFRKLAPLLVEGYTGPSELADLVDLEAPRAPAVLIEQAQELGRLVQEPEVDVDRRGWLTAQLSAISTALAWLDGQRFSYRELTERCHGVKAKLVPEEQFESAHRELGRALPGPGDVRARYQRWATTQLVPRSLLLPGLEALAKDLGRRTQVMFGLPAGEVAAFELVTGEWYAGSAVHRGGLRTRIAINEELPIGSFRLLELVSHEAYPGHHTETVCKDAELVVEQGRVELAAFVYPTPQALLAEGIACHAVEALLGDEAEEVAAGCLRPLGVAYDVEIAAAVREAERRLLGVRSNVAIMLDEGRLSTEQARAYARRWMLQDDEQVDRSVESLENRAWPPYESCYPEGLALCRGFAAGDPTRFRRLLREQLTPAQLGRR